MTQSRAIATHAEHGGSWMLPEAKSEDLLYLTNVYTVTVYSYPNGKHVGTLKNFYRPLGECADGSGDVFIANQDTILKYAHGGAKPIQTLTMTGYQAENCSVDPTTGNLAVTWGTGLYGGYVAIYPHASGSAMLYTHGKMAFAWCGYDGEGALFVDGFNKGNTFEFAELPAGGSKLQTISLNQSFQNGGAVQWDGEYIVVDDNSANTMYRFSVSGSYGMLEGTVSLGNASGLYQTWIDRKRVVGANDNGNAALYWNYPAGGTPTKSITKGVDYPFGATISVAPSR